MNKIQFISFGGQNEKNKSCHALIINGDFYVLSCGIQTPPNIILGIQKVVPNFDYLLENKSKIKGIFFTIGEYEQFGGLEFLFDQLPNIPIYTSNFGKIMIDSYFKNNVFNKKNWFNKQQNLNIKVIKPMESYQIGNAIVTAFRTSSYFLSSYGFIFTTNDESIIYLDKFIIPTTNTSQFDDLINGVNQITRKKNLLLLTSVGENVDFCGFTSPNYSIKKFFNDILIDSPNKIIVAIDACDLYKINVLINLCCLHSIPFYLAQQEISDLFDYLIQNKLINTNNLMKINHEQISTIKHCVIIVSSYRQKLINEINKIIVEENEFIKFCDDDTFIYALHNKNGFEKHEANIFDSINRLKKIKIYKLPKTILKLSQAQEDHKFIISLFKPKYIIPLDGLYMNFVKYKNAIEMVNGKKENILITDNGQIVTFANNNLVSQNDKSIKINLVEQRISTHGFSDKNGSKLFESQQMATDGCVLISLLINKEEKKITKFNYNPVGVINLLEEKNKILINEMSNILNQKMNEILGSLTDKNSILSHDQQDYFTKQVTKLYERKLGKHPKVLLTIIYNNSISN